MRRGPVLLALAALLAPAAPARGAGDPIMPLSEVRPGMKCSALTVLQGTSISSFAVEIVDIVDAGAYDSARLLVRTGPGIETFGIAEGFSGSPVYCPRPDGTSAVAGAISYGIGAYGNQLNLATPIEEVLGTEVVPPSGTRRAPGIMRRARPLRAPMVLTGLPPGMARTVSRAARRSGQTLRAAPSGPVARYPKQELVPGASMAAGLSSGALSLGSVGTVTYRDGNRVWGFGHPLDGVGRRALFLQDAYVYAVVPNPDGVDAVSYKLAAPGHDVGTLTSDGLSGVAGRLGAPPPRVRLTVTARDLDRDRRTRTVTRVADETDIGNPAGSSALSLIAPLAASAAGTDVLDGAPSAEFATACVRVRLRELERPLRFCNRYALVGSVSEDGTAPAANAIASDVAGGIGKLEAATFRPVHIKSVDVSMSIARGRRQAYLTRLELPARVRPGQTVGARVSLRRYRGREETRSVRLEVPAGLTAGRRRVTLVGTPLDEGESVGEIVIELGDQGSIEDRAGDPGARNLAALARRFESTARYDGVRSAWRRRPGGRARFVRRAFRDPAIRISGTASARVQVVDARR